MNRVMSTRTLVWMEDASNVVHRIDTVEYRCGRFYSKKHTMKEVDLADLRSSYDRGVVYHNNKISLAWNNKPQSTTLRSYA